MSLSFSDSRCCAASRLIATRIARRKKWMMGVLARFFVDFCQHFGTFGEEPSLRTVHWLHYTALPVMWGEYDSKSIQPWTPSSNVEELNRRLAYFKDLHIFGTWYRWGSSPSVCDLLVIPLHKQEAIGLGLGTILHHSETKMTFQSAFAWRGGTVALLAPSRVVAAGAV